MRGLKGSGKPPPQIAEELGIAVSTVYYHLGKPARPVGGARRAVVAGLGYAGLRISELCALERRSLRLHVGRLDVEDAKTPTGIREVDLTPVLRDELVVHRAWMASAGFDVAARARVYQSGSGRPLTPSNVRRMLRVLRRQTNARREARALNPLPHITPHTLRRTYISVLLLASGGDVEYVMSQVGHADAETTMRIYSQLLKRAKRDHGRAFDSLVAEARETVLGSHGEPTEASERTGGPAPNWHTNWHKSPKRGPDAALAVWSEAAISMD